MAIQHWLNWNRSVEIEAENQRGSLALWAAAEVVTPLGATALAHLDIKEAGGPATHAWISSDPALAALICESFFAASPWATHPVIEGRVEVRASSAAHIEFAIAFRTSNYHGWLQAPPQLATRAIDPDARRPWTCLQVSAPASGARLLHNEQEVLLIAPRSETPAHFRASWSPCGTWAR